ncbi:hypothetical protein Mapa_011075 [Marchantia paleacea]|nr:hypothetical protein Mapa_011075 [Marchantia paleacea]
MGTTASLYSWLTAGMAPFIMLHYQGRRILGLEFLKHGQERRGYPSALKPGGPLIWFHAVSVGEAMEALPMIRKCLEARPLLNILMSTSTVSAFSVLQKILPQRVICQFAPIDTPAAVDKFLTYWQPRAAIFMESELWPNLILATSIRGIPLALLNAKMSPASHRRWSLSPVKGLVKDMITRFTLIAPVNNKESIRYQNLGALPHQIHYGGNLKYASGAMDFSVVDGPVYQGLRKQMLGRRAWLAASTHKGEEKVIVSVHKRLKRLFPNLLTIIAPRHPDRGTEIKNNTRDALVWEVARRSINEPLTIRTEVYIADTLGELAIFYHLVTVAFVGGSLFQGLNGHNIAEPASVGCAVITGYNVGHFQDMIAEMLMHSPLAVEQVSGEDELYECMRRLLENGRSLAVRREAALAASNAARANVVNRNYRLLNVHVLNQALGKLSGDD